MFAYSNAREGEKTLVVFNNRYADTTGTIHTAVVTGRSLASGLGLGGAADDYLVMRDERTELLYLRSEADLASKGLLLHVVGYGCHVFAGMETVHDSDGRYGRLAAYLAGRGVPSLEDAMRELNLAPLHAAVREERTEDALKEAAALLGVADGAGKSRAGAPERLETLVSENRPDLSHGAWIYEWHLDRVWPDADLIAIRLDRSDSRSEPGSGNGKGKGSATASARPRQLKDLLRDDRFQRAIGTNEHDGARWFNRERFEKAIEALALPRRAELRKMADKSGYKLDELERLLSELPNWASTRPARPIARVAKPARPRAPAASKTPSKKR